MPKTSAGLLVYRLREGAVEVFLVHPGGPLWAHRDEGAWSIPKGEFDERSEDPLTAAQREFREETAISISGQFRALAPVRQAGGKLVRAWSVEGDLDAAAIRSNHFTLEWPPRSGRLRRYAEIDRAGWFTLPEARRKLNEGQLDLLDQLAAMQS
jgi:predicted NUDIX family NTP pyrophosphohydrolase